MKEQDTLVSTYEVCDINEQSKVVALIYEASRNTLSQENYSLWVQIQEGRIHVSVNGINVRPAQMQCSSEEQFREVVSMWLQSNGVLSGWITKHKMEPPQRYSIGKDEDVLSADELNAIPNAVTPTSPSKMAVPVGGFMVKIPKKE